MPLELDPNRIFNLGIFGVGISSGAVIDCSNQKKSFMNISHSTFFNGYFMRYKSLAENHKGIITRFTFTI